MLKKLVSLQMAIACREPELAGGRERIITSLLIRNGFLHRHHEK